MTTLEDELIKAAQDGDLLAVVQLFQDGVNLNYVNKFGWTALLTSCDRGHSEVALLLIDKGTNVNDRGFSNSTPLIRAAREGMVAVVKALLSKGANVNAVDDSHYTPLINASSRGHREIVELLIKNQGNEANVNDFTLEGETALHKAVKHGHTDLVSYLLENGADFQATNKTGKSPLDLAKEKGFTDIMRILRAAISRSLLQNEVKTSTEFLNERLNEVIDRISELQTQVTDTAGESQRLKQELARDIECQMSDFKNELLKFKEQVLRKNKGELCQTNSKLYMVEMRLNKVQGNCVAQNKVHDERLKNLHEEAFNLKEKMLGLKVELQETRLNDKAEDGRKLEELRSDLNKMQTLLGNSWRIIDFEVDKLMMEAHLNKLEKDRIDDKTAMNNQLRERDEEIEHLRKLIVEQDRKYCEKIDALMKELKGVKEIDEIVKEESVSILET